jgi:polyferredoxin
MLGPLDLHRGGEPADPRASGSEPAAPRALEQARGLVQISPAREKNRFVRAPPDRTQRWRRALQIAFLLLNVAIGIQFWFFVRFFESGGEGIYLPRPPGIEGWLPIAALMNLKAAVLTGELPRRFPAGLFLLVAFLAITFLFRKAFCSWLCPVGTLSEGLWKLGRRLFRRTFALPRWADWPLRALKYLLLAFFLWAVAKMSVEAIHAFLASPYGLVADVKMLNFFRHMGPTAAVVVGVVVAASVLVQNFWCRYLCPYGALHGFVSWLSPLRIRRDPEACIDCARCAKACPSRLAVDVKLSISSPECTGCMECVAACPVKGALGMSATHRRRTPVWAIAVGIAAVFLAATGIARLTGRWHTDVDSRLYYQIIPRAADFGHPH